MPKTRPRASGLPLREITPTTRLALTLFAAQVLRHMDTVCPIGNCRRHRCCTIDDARTGAFLCVLLLYDDERRAFDAALALAEHLCLHFIAGDLGDWYRRRLSVGAEPGSVMTAVEIVARTLPKGDPAAVEFRAFFRKQAVVRAAAASQCRSGTESGNGTAAAKTCNRSSSI